jgi:hypothetical protein
MFDNRNKAEKLVEKSRKHKSIFLELKTNLEISVEEMRDEDINLEQHKKEIEEQQLDLRAETISNTNVIANIDNILGTTE